MIADAISEKVGVEISHRQIDSQPLRMIGEHPVHIRLTVDLIPEISVIVHREGETVQQALEEAAELAAAEAEEFYEEEVEEIEVEEEPSEAENEEEAAE